jgi:DNA-binding Lrp family transcriptional regulator
VIALESVERLVQVGEEDADSRVDHGATDYVHRPQRHDLHRERPLRVRVGALRQQRQEQQKPLRVEPADRQAPRRLPHADRGTVDAFQQAVAAVPHVLAAQRLFGDPDYLLRVIARDLPAFQKLYDERLATLPGVQRLSSTLVMKSVVENRPLPL